MRFVASIIILALLIVGAGYVYWEFFYIDADAVGKAYLEKLMAKDYQQLSEFYHSQYPAPDMEKLAEAFASFTDAYGLINAELVGINLVDKSLTKAQYTVDLRYESKYFQPLMVQFPLELSWDGLFTWKVLWKDVLPLPQHGISARYRRTRIESARGSIYDRNGVLLAGKGSVVSIGVQPGRIKDPDQLFQVLQQTLGLSPDYVKGQYQRPGVQDHWFVPLITVSEQMYRELDPILRPVPGVFFQRQYVRAYPLAEAAAHLTGYIGEVSQAMIDQYPERDYQVGESVGRSGLEAGLESELRGMPGYQLFVQVERQGESLFLEQPVVHGQDMYLTIDSKMQKLAYEVLSGLNGALVILDAQTGEVLALAASPSFDPNEFAKGISSARWQALSNDPNRPLFNRALQGLYPPGSVFKVVTAAAALDLGLFDLSSVFTDTGELRVQGNVISNFRGETYGEHTLADALIRSINTTMAQVGLAVGANRLSDYFTKWGLNQNPDFHLPSSSGSIGDPARSQVALAWTAIGQDRVLLTPLHVAQIFTAFVNEGSVPKLHILMDEKVEHFSVMKPETVAAIDQVLQQVVTMGTGRNAAIPGIKVCGKTGTAETGSGSSHAWFGGYAIDVQDRDLAFAVIVENGGVGGEIAAPIIKQFLTRLVSEQF